MVKRLLVLTALEETWGKKSPILFLGEWCRKHSRKKKWVNLNHKVMDYHWDDRQKLHKDYLYIDQIYEKLLKQISDELNNLHSTNKPLIYWRILIGPWLGYFLAILFDRWFMVKRAIDDKEVKAVYVISNKHVDCLSHDMADFLKKCTSDSWNEYIYGELLQILKFPNIISIQKQSSDLKKTTTNFSYKNLLYKFFKNFLFLISKINVKKDKFFFINTYLPIKINFLLQLKFKQIPKISQSSYVDYRSFIKDCKRKEVYEFLGNPNNFHDISLFMVMRHIPISYMEGYKHLKSDISKFPWPSMPKVIFTSDSYSSDDAFKAWTAEKILAGSKLIIGQHGGSYGMAKWSFSERHQITIAHKFISWGWNYKLYNNINELGIIKTIGQKIRHNPNGTGLLILMASPRYSYHMMSMPVATQLLDYFDDQFMFYSLLPKKIKRQMLVRPYLHDYGWDQQGRWVDHSPKVVFDNPKYSIISSIKKSRIFISTYNATSYLESLSLNIPTVIFWDTHYWEIRDDVKEDFNLLASVGIFHLTPLTAANHVSEIWNNVDKWWFNDEVQTVRMKFCNKYAREITNPIEKIKAILDS